MNEANVQKLTPGDPETQSEDVLGENVAQLGALFPDAVVEGRIDFDVLRQLLGDAVEDREEKYGLTWHGKRRARQIALTPSTGTLRPCPSESVDWETTQNLMIEGDNLEVLKLLQKSYAGKVKLIYIDPPYNTGNDFVYRDDYADSIRHYLETTRQVDDAGRRVSTNTESSGRFHTDWLNMMYPRLRLARSLLREDGVVFVSIADHEVHNLRLLMNAVFGEENFVATVIWQKVFSPKNTARHFSEDHDYLVVYARSGEVWTPSLLPRTEEMEARYANPDNDPRGPWTSGDLSARNYYSEGTYPITCPSGRLIAGPPQGMYWRVKRARFDEMDRDNRIWWGANGNNAPRLKRFLTDVRSGRVPQTLWVHGEVGNTQEAKKELLELVTFASSDSMFETPKPTRLIRRMLQLATAADDESLVMDFFAGSGSTMHAVMAQNAADGGNRRCILVQLPEPIPGAEAGPVRTIAQMAEERLRHAGAKIRSENPMFAGDTGFRVFKLDSTNIRAWEPDYDALEVTLETAVEHLKADRTEQDILYELLLKLGLDLCVPIERRAIADREVHAVGGGALLVCLAPRIGRTDVEDLANGIAAWFKELAPGGDATCVFRDSAFEDDVAKTNMAAILAQRGLTRVRSL